MERQFKKSNYGSANDDPDKLWQYLVTLDKDVRNIFDYVNLIPPPLVYYGSFFGDDINALVTIGTAGVYYAVASSMTAGYNKQFTFQNNRELLCKSSGKYRANWSMTISTATPNKVIEGAVMINATAQSSTVNATETASANKDYGIGGCGIIRVLAGQTVKLCLENETDTTNVTVNHANLVLAGVDNY